MRVKNETNFRTSDLKAIITEAIRQAEKDNKQQLKYKKDVIIFVVNSKYWMSGCAHYFGDTMKIRIPSRIESWGRGGGTSPQKDLAFVAYHETFHLLGYKHSQMPTCKWSLTKGDKFAWAEELPIRYKELQIKPKRNLRQERHTHAKKMLTKHQRRLKLQKTLTKKWADKVKYYERNGVS